MQQLMQQLMEPADLAALLEPGRTEDLPVVVHIGDPQSYAAGHIPDAVLVTPAQLVSGAPPATGRLPERERLDELFSELGYDPSLSFVAYDDEGGGWAGRFLWTLDVIGHSRWHYLNGGLHAWVHDGLPLERVPHRRAPAPTQVSIDHEHIAEVDDVLESIDDPNMCVWDCRSAAEYRGEKRAAARAGHIPGAVNLDWLELMDPDRGLRLRDDLTDLLARHGISPSTRLITHCQTHHRSGLSYLVARLLGFESPRAYHGSWSEWGNRDDTPIHTGPDP